MRTTIEISDKHRGALLSIAAQKGLKGYSKIIEDAIEHYISDQVRFNGIKTSVLSMKGNWGKEAEEIKTSIKELRKNWEK